MVKKDPLSIERDSSPLFPNLWVHFTLCDFNKMRSELTDETLWHTNY
jgi:hypothetical protein